MNGRAITLGVWFQDPAVEQQLTGLADRSPRLDLATASTSLEEVDMYLTERPLDVLVVEYEPGIEGQDFMVERFHLHHPYVNLLFLSSVTDSNAVLQAMRLGAREYLTKPLVEKDFVSALVRLTRRMEASRAESRRAGHIIAVMGAKGGIGVTTIAINLAAELAQAGSGRVGVVDLNLTNPDVSAILDVDSVGNISDVVRDPDRIDELRMMENFSDYDGLFLALSGPSDFVEAAEVRPDAVDKFLLLSTDVFDWLILDVGCGASDSTLKALDRSELVFLVTKPSVVSVKNAKRVQSLFARLGYGPEKVKIVSSRQGGRGDLSAAQLKTVFNEAPYFSIPDDEPSAHAAEGAGRPLYSARKRSVLRKSFVKLAGRLVTDFGRSLQSESGPNPSQERPLRVVRG